MRKNYIISILTMVFCAGFVLTGCSNNETVEEETPVEETTQVIGDSSAPLAVDMINNLGSVITGLSVKKPEMLIFPDNMMTADQSIENEETVKFYYDPEDSSSEDVNVKPTQNYMGYWNQSGSIDEELDIWDITDDTVTFHLWWYRITETEDITVTLDENYVGTFTGMVNEDFKIEGEISFTANAVKVTIDQSDFEYIHPEDGPYVFDKKHAVSWEYGTEKDAAEEAEAEAESDQAYMLQVTLVDDAVYELSGFDMNDMEDVKLCYEDDVSYLEYTKLSSNETVNTKDTEQTIKQDKEAAQPVIDQIALIETVTLDSEEEITAAREAYDALTDAQKTYVYNEPLLLWKEVTFRMLQGEAAKTADVADYDEEYDEDYTEGDNWAWGYQLGISGMTEEEAKAEWNKYGEADTSSKYYQQYYNDFWEGFWTGYGEYTPAGQDMSRADRNRAIANGGGDPWEDDEVYGDWDDIDDDATDWD